MLPHVGHGGPRQPGSAAPDERLGPRRHDGAVELLRVLRGQRARDDDAGLADLLEALGDQIGADGGRVGLLQLAGGLGPGRAGLQGGDLLEQRARILVAVTVLGEQMPAARWAGFGLIWLSLAVFTLDQLNASRLQRRAVRAGQGAHA